MADICKHAYFQSHIKWNLFHTEKSIFHAVKTATRPTQPPVQYVPNLSRGYSGRSVLLGSHFLLVPGCERVAAIPTPPLCACTGMSSGDLYIYSVSPNLKNRPPTDWRKKKKTTILYRETWEKNNHFRSYISKKVIRHWNPAKGKEFVIRNPNHTHTRQGLFILRTAKNKTISLFPGAATIHFFLPHTFQLQMVT
jgi:hypothetical protein